MTHRRQFLAALAAGVGAGGCLELRSPSERTATETRDRTPATTRERATATPTAVSTSTGTADWPGLRRGPRNSASVPEAAGPQSKPTAVRRLTASEGELRTAAVVDGTVYASDDDGGVHAFDSGTGQRRWYTPGTGAIFHTPAVADGTVVVGAGDAGVKALDAETGQQRWSWSVRERVTSAPAIADGTVYAGRETVAALALDSGREQWQRGFEHATGTPAVTDGTVVVPAGNGSIVGLDRATGRRRFRFSAVLQHISEAVIVARSAYVPASDGSIRAIHLETGDQRWATTIAEPSDDRSVLPLRPAVAGSTLVTGVETDGSVTVVGLDMADGSTRWTWSPDSFVSAPVAAGPTVYLCVGTRLTAIAAADGSERWTIEHRRVPDTLVLAGGRLYVQGNSIRVYAD
ncbi:outer membrane protein assembly factor BamB family protein [Haloarcula halophila]|uniref:outer membrane protein assembly factor BamB family protein n=1 Tax=Haloarcula TaxID=2237 RepID=UPI0023E46D7F|nr:PQQ-binding-like beta-propeller repeat protein [Halomicroarcula sp. DFY41]